MEIPFNIPAVTGKEKDCVDDAIQSRHICGDNGYTVRCEDLIQKNYHCDKALLTTSCTHALELAAMICGIEPGDEIIMPSYTFVSTANAFVLRGAKIVFVDIRPDTQNIDETLIEAAVSSRTKAIVPVHYAGVSCEMESILRIADAYHLSVVEDAAQGVHAFYNDRALGTMGRCGCYSFHETKNYTMGEGGALLVNAPSDSTRAEIIREKGTNRAEFLLGMVDKYTWVEKGSSYLPSDINAAYLYPQLQDAELINRDRLERWGQYYENLSDLARSEKIQLPIVPKECRHNAHMFYIKTRDIEERTALMERLRQNGVTAAFHYVPLHSSPQGRRAGVFHGEDQNTTDTANRLLRLPMYYKLTPREVDYVCEIIHDFYRER